jgi:N-carbamoylputrescine amidase
LKKFLAAGIQQTCGSSAKENLDKTIVQIREAKKRGAELIVLQELHKSLYFCQQERPEYFDLAEPIPGPSTETLGKISKELSIVIVSSLFEKRAPGLYHNTAAVLDDGRLAGTYRKMHIPDDPGYYEKYYFTPGDTGFRPIETTLGKIGVLVCWDQWYPEAARCMALSGADILVYPTAIGWEKSDTDAEKTRQLDAWTTVQRSHAIANGLYVIAVNRTGFEKNPGPSPSEGIDFWGNSFIAGPQGELLAQALSGKEEIILSEIDLSRSENIRRAWPFLRDRRIDAYGNLLKRFGE